MPDVQHIRTTSAREDKASEDLRVERAEEVAQLAYERARRSVILSLVAFILSIATIAQQNLFS